MRKFDIPLSGLSYMGCARKVERELTSQHQVNIHDLTPQHITLDSDSPFVDLEQSIQSLGYQAGHQYQFHLSGLSCGKCVAKLESALEESDDIGQFDVSKTTLSLSTLLTQQQVKDLVASLGYQASESESEIEEPETQPQATQPSSHLHSSNNKETLHFLISGMTCASCVASVERALIQVEGVDKAQVNLAEQSALVFSTSKDNKTINAIANAVEEAGYQAEIVDDPATQQEKQQAQQMTVQAHHKKSAWAGIVIGVPLMLWGVLGGNMMIRTIQDQLIWGVVGIICFWLLANAGKSFFSNAWQALTHKRATMDTLVALGTGAAWLFSM